MESHMVRIYRESRLNTMDTMWCKRNDPIGSQLGSRGTRVESGLARRPECTPRCAETAGAQRERPRAAMRRAQ